MLKVKTNKGFTIIEVVITIAIGAAVMALVLNAVNGARRSQRNTQRRADVSAIAGAVNQFYANRNTMPTEIGDIKPLLDEYNALSFYTAADISPAKIIDGTNPTAAGAFYEYTTAVPSGATTGTDHIAKAGSGVDYLAVVRGAACKADQVAITSNQYTRSSLIELAGKRQALILFRVEGDASVYCQSI